MPEQFKHFLDNANQLTKQFLGAKTEEEAAKIVREILSGLANGARIVTQNSFLIKADIEKSGAAHEH